MKGKYKMTKFIHIFMFASIIITNFAEKETFALFWLGLAGALYVWYTMDSIVCRNQELALKIKREKKDNEDFERFSKFLKMQVEIMKEKDTKKRK